VRRQQQRVSPGAWARSASIVLSERQRRCHQLGSSSAAKTPLDSASAPPSERIAKRRTEQPENANSQCDPASHRSAPGMHSIMATPPETEPTRQKIMTEVTVLAVGVLGCGNLRGGGA
jgi:hypothetical protein